MNTTIPKVFKRKYQLNEKSTKDLNMQKNISYAFSWTNENTNIKEKDETQYSTTRILLLVLLSKNKACNYNTVCSITTDQM